MQVKNIKIENFKSIQTMEIPELKKFTVITGPNGAGKTSLLNAIRYIVTGETPSNPVRSGCDITSAEAELFGSTVKRMIKNGKNEVKVNNKKTTAKSLKSFIESNSGVSYSTAKIATSAKLLDNMQGGALAEYLVKSGMIPATADFATMKKLCPTITPEIEKQLRLFLADKFNLDEVDKAHDDIFAARKALKKEIDAKKIVSNFEGTVPARTVAKIDAEINKLSSYNLELENYKKLLKQYDMAVQNRETILTKIKEIETKLKGMKIAKIDPQEEKFLRDQLSKIDEQIRSVKSTIELIKNNNEMFKRTLDNLDKPICPISEKLICTTDKTKIKEELNTLVKNNNDEINKQNDIITNLLEKRSKLTEKIKDFNERVKQHQAVSTLDSQLKAYRASIPVLPEKPVEPKAIKDFDKIKDELNEERKIACKYEDSIKAKTELVELEKLLNIYNQSVKILSPKDGIRGQIIGLALEPLVNHANARAADLKMDFSIKLVSDNGVNIFCSPKNSCDMVELSAVSSGEQAYALFLIMDALNALSGYGIVMLDDLDKLDENALDALLSLFEKPGVMDNYDHIIVAMVNHEDSMRILKKHEKTLINEHICI